MNNVRNCSSGRQAIIVKPFKEAMKQLTRKGLIDSCHLSVPDEGGDK